MLCLLCLLIYKLLTNGYIKDVVPLYYLFYQHILSLIDHPATILTNSFVFNQWRNTHNEVMIIFHFNMYNEDIFVGMHYV